MTQQNSFKRLVRARMEKTGESYTAARANVLAAEAPPKASEGPALIMSGEAIRRRTGVGWEDWFERLDAWAGGLTHTEIARRLQDEGVPGWDAQSITVSYERARGLRAVGERPGGFSITASRTVAVPVERLFDAFADPALRAEWLVDDRLRERTATKPKSARYDWDGGDTRVIVGFEARGEDKSTVFVEHERLPDGDEAERMKRHWRDALSAMKARLEREDGRVRSADGTRIASTRIGDGPAVVLVDGALSARAFGPLAALVPLLAEDFTVFHYDRRGRGASGDTQPYAVAREVEDLAAVAAEAGGAPTVLGMSSGAALALEAAASGVPMARLALYEPPLSVEAADDDGFADHIAELIAEGRRGDAVAFFLTSAGVPPDAVEGMRDDPSWARFESVAPTLVYDNAILGDGVVPRERAADVAVPTLVANGAESPDFFAAAARATAEAIPGARHTELAGQSWGQVDPGALATLVRELVTA